MPTMPFDVAKVRQFGQTLHDTPSRAVALADTLSRGAPFTGMAGEIWIKFLALTPWEQASVIDELRDAMDKYLGEVFRKYAEAARILDP